MPFFYEWILASLHDLTLPCHDLPSAWIDTKCHCGGKIRTRSFVVFLYKHSVVTKLLSRATGWREASAVRNGRAYCYNEVVNRVAPDKSTPVAGGSLKIHQATSGIMSGISLMCESRVLPLCESKWGETREEGVVLHLICTHSVMFTKKADLIWSALLLFAKECCFKKTAIFRWRTRKALSGQSEAYLTCIRFHTLIQCV